MNNLLTAALPSANSNADMREAVQQEKNLRSAGKIDGLVELADGRLALKEDKTTGDSISSESDYWLRLRFNSQLMQYVLAARQLGWDVAVIIYDVVRKPAIRPKQIKVEGVTRTETPEEFSKRLFEDTQSRPEFYFARREVPILESDLEEFTVQRLTLARIILHCRQLEKKLGRREQAWPRNVSELSCQSCPYSSFCLQNLTVDLAHPPTGFRVLGLHPELQPA